MAAEVWVATAPIWLGNVRAYNVNNVVPDSVVAQFGLEAEGLVERRPASDTGVPSHGVNPATQTELDNAIGSRAAASEVFAGDGKFRVDKLPASVPRTVNGKAPAANGDVVLSPADVGALPSTTKATDIGGLDQADFDVLTTGAGRLSDVSLRATFGSRPGFVNLRDYLPSAAPGNVDYAPFVQAALAALPSKGGALYIPSDINGGVIGLGSTVVVPGSVRIYSDHFWALRIVKLANVPLFDCSGQPTGSGGISVNQKKYITFENLTLAGAELEASGSGGTGGYGSHYSQSWTAPLVLCHYTQFINFRKVWFRNNYGKAAYGVKWWDTEFASCRFDNLGNPADPDGSCVHMARKGQGAAPGSYLDADDNPNNVNFTGQTVFEQNRVGALFVDGRRADGTIVPGDSQPNRFSFSDLKIESMSASVATPYIRIDYAQIIRFNGTVDLVIAATSSVIAGLMQLTSCNDVKIAALNLQTGPVGSSSGFGSALRARSITGLFLTLTTGYVDTTNKPTVGLLDIDGTNAGVELGPYRYIYNPGGAPLAAGIAATATYEARHMGAGLRMASAPLATTLGTVSRRIAIVDNSGATLGYVPVYGTIT